MRSLVSMGVLLASSLATAQTGPIVISPETQPPQPQVQNQQPAPGHQPTYLNVMQKKMGENAGRAPSQEQSTTTSTPTPVGSQLSFFEFTPFVGAGGIKGRSTFLTGFDLSFRISDTLPLYFEPGVTVGFLNGDSGSPGSTLFSLNAGLRYDFVISGSPLVPFLKLAGGPTLGTSSTTVVRGNPVPNSYFDLFAGGGFKLLINPRFGARLEGGITLQGTDSGAYGLGALVVAI